MAPHAAKRRKIAGQEPETLSDSGAGINTNRESDRDEDDSQSEESSEDEEQTKKLPSRSTTGHARGRPKPSAGQALIKSSYKSGLFGLQVDELLADVRHDRDKKRDRIDTLLRRVKEIIEHIPEREELPV